MQYIDAETVHRHLDYPDLIQGLDELHKTDTQAMNDLLLAEPVNDAVTNHILIRAAWQYGQAVGTKLATIFPDNAKRALPGVHGLYVLFDGIDGTPKAVIDGTALTYYKTAADSALGSKYLARDDAAHLLMVGAGAMAPHLIRAHCAARPSINRVFIWNRTRANADTLASSLHLDGIEIQVRDNLERGVREADIVSCATMAREPIVLGAWLSPGAHLDLVGAFTPDMRETDDEAFRRARVFVDSRNTTIGEIGEIILPMESGALKESDILADHYDLCRGRHPGRESDTEITLMKNGGGGHLDLMTARFLLRQIGD